MHAGLNRAERPIEGLCDLAIAQTFHFPQNDSRPVLGLDRLERALQIPSDIETLMRPARRLVVSRLELRLLGAPLAPSELVLGPVESDPVEPTPKAARASKMSCFSVRCEKGVLSHILRESAVAKDAEDEVPDPSLIADDQLFESPLVAMDEPVEEHFVGVHVPTSIA